MLIIEFIKLNLIPVKKYLNRNLTSHSSLNKMITPTKLILQKKRILLNQAKTKKKLMMLNLIKMITTKKKTNQLHYLLALVKVFLEMELVFLQAVAQDYFLAVFLVRIVVPLLKVISQLLVYLGILRVFLIFQMLAFLLLKKILKHFQD